MPNAVARRESADPCATEGEDYIYFPKIYFFLDFARKILYNKMCIPVRWVRMGVFIQKFNNFIKF